MSDQTLQCRIENGNRIYTNYQGTPIGATLTEVLNELKDVKMVTDKQIEILTDEFDKVMTEQLAALPDDESFTISQGKTVDHKVVVDYRQIIMQPVTIQFSDGAVTSSSMEILAVRGNLKEPDEQPKRGRKKQ